MSFAVNSDRRSAVSKYFGPAMKSLPMHFRQGSIEFLHTSRLLSFSSFIMQLPPFSTTDPSDSRPTADHHSSGTRASRRRIAFKDCSTSSFCFLLERPFLMISASFFDSSSRPSTDKSSSELEPEASSLPSFASEGCLPPARNFYKYLMI